MYVHASICYFNAFSGVCLCTCARLHACVCVCVCVLHSLAHSWTHMVVCDCVVCAFRLARILLRCVAVCCSVFWCVECVA